MRWYMVKVVGSRKRCQNTFLIQSWFLWLFRITWEKHVLSFLSSSWLPYPTLPTYHCSANFSLSKRYRNKRLPSKIQTSASCTWSSMFCKFIDRVDINWDKILSHCHLLLWWTSNSTYPFSNLCFMGFSTILKIHENICLFVLSLDMSIFLEISHHPCPSLTMSTYKHTTQPTHTYTHISFACIVDIYCNWMVNNALRVCWISLQHPKSVFLVAMVFKAGVLHGLDDWCSWFDLWILGYSHSFFSGKAVVSTGCPALAFRLRLPFLVLP